MSIPQRPHGAPADSPPFLGWLDLIWRRLNGALPSSSADNTIIDTIAVGGSLVTGALVSVSGADPQMYLKDTGGDTDEKLWRMRSFTSAGTTFYTLDAIDDAITTAGEVFRVERGSGTAITAVTFNNTFVVSAAALSTSATSGFLYVPGCAGAPAGTPTAYAGRAPVVVDTTNHKLYFYSGGLWRDAGP